MKPCPESAAPWRLLLLAALLLAGIIVPYLFFGAAIEAWTARMIEGGASHPAWAAALLGTLLAVDVLLPVPSSVVSTACGLLLGFLPGLLVSFVGMTLSAIGGYALGWLAAPAARRGLGAREAAQLTRIHARWGVWMLAAVRPVPVLAEASVLFAGLARVPWRTAWLPLLAANLGVSTVYAAVGAWAARGQAFPFACAAALLLSGGAMWAARRFTGEGKHT